MIEAQYSNAQRVAGWFVLSWFVLIDARAANAIRSDWSASSAVARRYCGKMHTTIQTKNRTPASSQAWIIAWASSSRRATGFSQSTCFPACAASRTIDPCVAVGVEISTISTSSDKYSKWNPLRRVDKNQGSKRVDKLKIHHDSQNADRPEPYRNHNTDSEIKTGQCIEPEFVLSESESCHRAAKKYLFSMGGFQS